MKKKYMFYDKFAKTKSRLFILLLAAVFVSLGAGLGVLKISNIKSMGMGFETVYEDRVIPLKQLKSLSDIYGITVVNIPKKVLNNEISLDEGLKSIAANSNKISEIWDAYLKTYLVEEEKEKVNELRGLLKAADNKLEVLTEILNKGDHNSLAEFVNKDLHPVIEPVIKKIDELFQMQVLIVQNIREQEQKRIQITLKIGIASLVMSIILCVIVVLQWKRLRTLLEYF